MPLKGYHQSESHKKLLSIKAKLRGNNGWKNRKHRLDAIEKMRISALKRWARGRPQWFVKPVVKNKPEPVNPQVYEPYQDIYMVEGWEGIKDIL